MSIRTRLQQFLYNRRKKKSSIRFPVFCRAHGVKPPARQGALAQSKAGDKLQLVHVSLPDYPYNVYVYSIPLNRVLGYLDEGLSIKLVNLFGKNFCRDGSIENITGGAPYKYFGCNLQILETAELMKHEESFQHLHGGF